MILNSPTQTRKLARALANDLLRKHHRRNALVLALAGDLGSGKTTFVQGFLRGLGVRSKITSPTFVLVKKYKLPNPSSQLLTPKPSFAYHVDCYRIKKSQDLLKLGLKEILANHENIVLIEWSEKIKRILPKNTIWLKFEHGANSHSRLIKTSSVKSN